MDVKSFIRLLRPIRCCFCFMVSCSEGSNTLEKSGKLYAFQLFLAYRYNFFHLEYVLCDNRHSVRIYILNSCD